MNRVFLFGIVTILLFSLPVMPQDAEPGAQQEKGSSIESIEERNKALAKRFYEEVWFSKNTDVALELVAPEYTVHDIGDRKGATEVAAEQKRIAEFFHSMGEMSGNIDYQIAEGDLVATRWQWKVKSTSWIFTILGGGTDQQIPIINVFRFNEEGKIVEVWNHRHDIDSAMASFNTIWGFVYGFAPTAMLALLFFILWRRAKKAPAASAG